MKKENIIVKNQLGLHARAAALLVEEASKYESEITLNNDGHEVDAKSIMGIMTLAAGMGTELIVVAEGIDEAKAMEGVKALFDSKFDEE